MREGPHPIGRLSYGLAIEHKLDDRCYATGRSCYELSRTIRDRRTTSIVWLRSHELIDSRQAGVHPIPRGRSRGGVRPYVATDSKRPLSRSDANAPACMIDLTISAELEADPSGPGRGDPLRLLAQSESQEIQRSHAKRLSVRGTRADLNLTLGIAQRNALGL